MKERRELSRVTFAYLCMAFMLLFTTLSIVLYADCHSVNYGDLPSKFVDIKYHRAEMEGREVRIMNQAQTTDGSLYFGIEVALNGEGEKLKIDHIARSQCDNKSLFLINPEGHYSGRTIVWNVIAKTICDQKSPFTYEISVYHHHGEESDGSGDNRKEGIIKGKIDFDDTSNNRKGTPAEKSLGDESELKMHWSYLAPLIAKAKLSGGASIRNDEIVMMMGAEGMDADEVMEELEEMMEDGEHRSEKHHGHEQGDSGGGSGGGSVNSMNNEENCPRYHVYDRDRKMCVLMTISEYADGKMGRWESLLLLICAFSIMAILYFVFTRCSGHLRRKNAPISSKRDL